VRSLLAFKLGAWVGIAIAAAFVKRAVPSRGDAESDELALVAIFDGIDLKSRAAAFSGGSALAWFGGIAVDLRDAQLAPGARLSLRTFCGGIAVKTPPAWRIEGNVTSLAGGAETRGSDDPDAPVLTVDGVAMLGGVAVGSSAIPAGEDAA
jgi:hypothetical protein